MIARKTARSVVVLWLLALICCAQWAHALDLEEYRVKASLLGNFAMFTEWPDAVGETLTLCVYGPDPFGEDLSSLKGKKIAKRSLAVKRVSSVDALGDCQIVFISRAVISNLPRVLDVVNGRPALTVADSPGAAARGVALNMATDGSKINFEANLRVARGNGLNLNSNMLRLATEVIK